MVINRSGQTHIVLYHRDKRPDTKEWKTYSTVRIFRRYKHTVWPYVSAPTNVDPEWLDSRDVVVRSGMG